MRYLAQSLSWLLFVLLAAGQAAAQDATRRKEAFAGGSLCSTGDIRGSCFVGGVAFPFGVTNSFDVDVLYVPTHRKDASGPSGWYEQTATQVLLNFVHHRGQGRKQFLLLASLGYAANRDRQGFANPGFGDIVWTDDYSSVAFGGGLGWELFLKSALSLRPQLRIVFGPAGDAAWVRADAGVSIGYHW